MITKNLKLFITIRKLKEGEMMKDKFNKKLYEANKNDEKLLERALELAIEKKDEKVLNVLEKVFYLLELEFFKKETFPAMIENRYAPALGWAGEFQRVSEYLNFIDEVFGKKGKGYEILSNYIDPYDYYSEDEIKVYKKEYGRDWKEEAIGDIISSFREKEDLETVIDIISEVLEDEMKKAGVSVEDYFAKNVFFYVLENFEEWLELASVEDIIYEVKRLGYFDKLKKALRDYL